MSTISSFSRREPAWRAAAWVVAGLILLACAGRALYRPLDGDFKLHWESGRRFLAGEFLYDHGHNLPYPPFWAMTHAPAALLPLPVAKALLLPVGVAALCGLLWILSRLTSRVFAFNQTQRFWVAALALFLVGRFIIRDMAELGVNTLLVALSWLGIYLWGQRRDLPGGASLGLAMALKCTPAIFAAWFLWKRQWRMFAASCGAAVIFTLAPVVWQGPASYREHLTTWLGNAWQGFGSTDPSRGVLGPEPLQNMSLRPALARYLMRLPPDHPGRAASPFHLDLLDLFPTAANWIIKAALLALLGGFLWWSRRSVIRPDDPALLWELAALSILMLLFSPITWGQHCVALLPPCYFIAALAVARGGLPRWMLVLLGCYILVVPILSRDLVGRDFALLLASYHVETFAILALVPVIIGSARLSRSKPDAGAKPALAARAGLCYEAEDSA